MPDVVVLKHPLVQHHLSVLRAEETPPDLFREQIRRLSLLLTYEAAAGHCIYS